MSYDVAPHAGEAELLVRGEAHGGRKAMSGKQAAKSMARALPYPVKSVLKWGVRQPARSKQSLRLAWDKYRIVSAGQKGKSVRLSDFDVRINGGGETPFDLYEDIFVNHVYDFDAQREDPRILDCGSNIGMSVLYFKWSWNQFLLWVQGLVS